jgi:hypothetical protein
MESNITFNLPYKYLHSFNSDYRGKTNWKLFSDENSKLIEQARVNGKYSIDLEETINNKLTRINLDLKTMTIISKDLEIERVKRIPDPK